MLIIITVIIGVLAYMGFVVWTVHRSARVTDFRMGVLDLCDRYNRNFCSYKRKHSESAYSWFMANGPTHYQMVWSLKKLTLENWYPAELIKKLRYGNDDDNN